jgi:ssDNA-binding Zn-finger/Zn-ribbon topoisomerase 1
MYMNLKDQHYYEDLYDHQTVEDGRRDQPYYDKFLKELMDKLPEGDTIDTPRNAVVANAFYIQVVGLELLRRYENRDQRIREWILRDEAKDAQIASARLSDEPTCQHCGKQGLHITDKSLMPRGANTNYDEPEEVMFMLSCSHCKKNSAFWEDGEPWIVKPTICPKCSTEMMHKTASTKQYFTFTYTCPSCQHTYKKKMDLREKEEAIDPDYEKGRAHYCLHDEEFRKHLFEIRRGFTEMAELGEKFQEKEDNKHIYDAIKEMKKPKIAELTSLLQPVLEKASYIEFSLDKPEIGKDVYVGFNCLDTKPDRTDYDSRKVLEKTIKKALEDTNWRLMSEGIHYRLGYLNGRLRAYEREEDLKNIVTKSLKGKKSLREDIGAQDNNEKFFTAPNGSKIIL